MNSLEANEWAKIIMREWLNDIWRTIYVLNTPDIYYIYYDLGDGYGIWW